MALIFILSNFAGPLGIMMARADEPGGLSDVATLESHTAMDVQAGTYLRMVVDTEYNFEDNKNNKTDDTF